MVLRGSISIPAKDPQSLTFAVDDKWLVSQGKITALIKDYLFSLDGFFDITSGGKLVTSHDTDQSFRSCILREGLCYEETNKFINVLDPRSQQVLAGRCSFDSKRLNKVKFSVINNNLIIASDKIDIFDTRDLSRPILSSLPLVSSNRSILLYVLNVYILERRSHFY